MTIPAKRQFVLLLPAKNGGLAIGPGTGAGMGVFGVTSWRTMLSILAVAVIVCLGAQVRSQTLDSASGLSGTAIVPITRRMELPYLQPTQKTMFSNYRFDAFGPYPAAGAVFAAGINQIGNSPPEWNQGIEGYSKRFGSDYAIAVVATTTRYGLAEAFKEDTLYYRCECGGVFPRLRHAAISALTSRRGIDGHRVFSIPALVAPYAGSMTAVYGWYPDRFGVKDGFRIGNYSLLSYMGENIALEFFHSGPHSLLSRMHLNNTHGSPVEGPNK